MPDGNKKGINIIRNLVNILIEKRLFGSEVSVMGFCNGKEFMSMPQTQTLKELVMVILDWIQVNGAICPLIY